MLANAPPWQPVTDSWHAQVTITSGVGDDAQREGAVWQLQPAAGGFCVEITDVRQHHAGGETGRTQFDPVQLEGSGWCRDPALRTVGVEQVVEANFLSPAATAGMPDEAVDDMASTIAGALAFSQHLVGILLFDAWGGGTHTMTMPNGLPLRIACSQPEVESTERVVSCQLETAVLRNGMAQAAAPLIGMDADQLEQAMRKDMPDGPFVVVLQGRFAADSGLPESIAWIPDEQALMPAARFTFEWTRGTAQAPELPLQPTRHWIEHPAPPSDDAGSRPTLYRTTRVPPYPTDALALKEHGEVILRVLVGADGRVATVQVHRSSGSPALDASAQEDVAYWLFYPALENGLPVEQSVFVPVNFQIPGSQADQP